MKRLALSCVHADTPHRLQGGQMLEGANHGKKSPKYN